MRLHFGCAYSQDLIFQRSLPSTFLCQRFSKKAQTFFLPHGLSNFSPSCRGDTSFVDVGLLQTFRNLLHQTGSRTWLGAVSINDLAEQRSVPGSQPGQAGAGGTVCIFQSSTKLWKISEAACQGIHLGSQVNEHANGHHLFVSVLVL